jgi:hypothetical protein
MTDYLRALIEAELILQRMAADDSPAPRQALQVRVVKPGDPDYGQEFTLDEDGRRILRVTLRFDTPDASERAANED